MNSCRLRDDYVTVKIIIVEEIHFHFRSIQIKMSITEKGNVPQPLPGPTMYTLTTTPENGEYSDQDILNLVNYFEISRAELKSVSRSVVD